MSEPNLAERSCDISEIPVAVLAGGLATRLRPMTETVPKAMIEVAGKPFIDHQLDLLFQKGIRRVVICTGYLGELIQNHVGDGSIYGLKVQYSFDGKVLLGTGGAIRNALRLLNKWFFVTYGDTLLDEDYCGLLRTQQMTGLPAVMALLHNQGQWDSSNAEICGQLAIYRKSIPSVEASYIDYGISLMQASQFKDYSNRARFDLSEILETLAANGQLAAHEVKNRFYEIGTTEGLRETQQYLISRNKGIDAN
jgi:NDP-sugar pyrophosphorylase family protein